MLKFIGRLFFVFIFLGSALIKIVDPAPFSALLVDRYQRFQTLTKAYNLESLGSFVSLESMKIQANQLNSVVGVGQIVISFGILFGVPYLSVFFTLFLMLTILIIHNPLYFNESDKFNEELMHMTLEIAMIGITLILATNRTHSHVSSKGKKRNKPKVKKESRKNTDAKVDDDAKQAKKKKNEENAAKKKKDEKEDARKKKNA